MISEYKNITEVASELIPVLLIKKNSPLNVESSNPNFMFPFRCLYFFNFKNFYEPT